MRKLLIITFLISLFTFLYGCDSSNSSNSENIIRVTGIETEDYIEINIDESNTFQINAKILPANATEPGILYASEDENIATVDNNGKITALTTGTTYINVISKANPSIFIRVAVYIKNNISVPENVLSISLAQNSYQFDLNPLINNTVYKIVANVEPADLPDEKKGLEYLSNNISVAEVSTDGTITALQKGNAVITVKSINNPEITTEFSVEVIDSATPALQPAITVSPALIKLKTNETIGIDSKISITLSDEYKGKNIYYESGDSTILKVIGTAKQLITYSKTGQTTLRAGISGETGKYFDVTVIVEDASDIPADVPVYPDITPEDAETRTDRMYIKIQFDATSSSGDLYKENDYRGLDAVQFQTTYSLCGTNNNGVCSGDLLDKGNGYINPFGYCEKYGCKIGMSSIDGAKIAKYKMGITYYAGNNNLFVPVRSSGVTKDSIQVLFFIGGEGYARPNLNFSIDWNTYDPAVHKNIAKFYIKLTDKNPEINFVEFEKK